MTDTHDSGARPTLEFLEAMLTAAEATHGKDHPSILDILNAAAEFHLFNKNYDSAQSFWQRAEQIAASEPENTERLKLVKQKLGWLKFLQGKTDEARSKFQEAADVIRNDEKSSEEAVVQALRTLAFFYLKSGDLPQAEAVLKMLLEFFQSHQKKQDTNYTSAFVLVSLAVIADVREDLQESKQYSDQAAEIIKDKCAIGYTVDYLSLSEIINLYFLQDRKMEALELVGCALLESEDSYWPHNPVAGDSLAALAEFMRGQRKFKQAESIYRRAISIREFIAGLDDPDFARLSLNLGNMYLGLRKYADAEPLVKASMKARVKIFGVEHPSVAACVETYATILRKTKRVALANKLDVRAREIRSACVSRLDRELARS